MPNYIYKHPEKEEYIEVFQGMKDEHVYFDEEGNQWERRWTPPQLSVDRISDIDPFDIRKATDATSQRKGTIGDLWDMSGELSEKRAERVGAEDPLKKKVFNEYEKANGKKHWHDKPKSIEKNGIKVDMGSNKDLFKGYPND